MKIGIIGAGNMGKIHANILKGFESIDEIFIWDTKEIRAETLACSLACKKASSLDDLIKSSDAVYITTPNYTHSDFITLLSGKVKGIFCEKPMAIDIESAVEVEKTIKKSKNIFQVGFNRRFAIVYKTLSMYSEEIKPITVRAKMNRGELKEPPWVENTEITGGFLYESTIHILDLLSFLFGRVKSIYAVGEKKIYDELDTFNIIMEHSSGVVTSLFSISYSTWIFPFESIEVYGEHKAIVTEEMEKIKVMREPRGVEVTLDFSSDPVEMKWGYLLEDTYFIDRLCGKEHSEVPTEEDGYYACYLIEKIKESIREKKIIRLKG